MTEKRYPDIISETLEELAKWVREVTRIREEDVGNADKTRKDIEDTAALVPAAGTSGNVMTSNGTVWTSAGLVVPVKASGAELDTGTDDVKFATAKALKDSHNVPSVVPSTSGNVLTSNGTDWVSSAPVIVGRAYAEDADATARTTTLPADDTIPQNTEGNEIITLAYTAKSATNRLRFNFSGVVAGNTANCKIGIALFKDTTADALYASYARNEVYGAYFSANPGFVWEYVPGDTSAHTYKIRIGASAAGIRMNSESYAIGRIYGGVSKTVLIIEEIQA